VSISLQQAPTFIVLFVCEMDGSGANQNFAKLVVLKTAQALFDEIKGARWDVAIS
jgi:hypothetical protein